MTYVHYAFVFLLSYSYYFALHAVYTCRIAARIWIPSLFLDVEASHHYTYIYTQCAH